MSIQGQPLEVTVVSCSKLKDTEWISRQDPYVCVEYGNTKFRTRTCTDGGRNPVFQEKFTFPLIEGLRDINVIVWNSNTLSFDDFIGTGKIQLHKVLSQGYDDSTWPLQSKTGRHAGEVKLILHYAMPNHQLHNSSHAPYGHTHTPSVPLYSAPSYPAPAPSHSAPPYNLQSHYPPQPYPASSPYPSSQHPSPYPPSPYPPPSSYPPSSYPPQPSYPPPAPGMYPPPPY
ncbi:elicitor-responsive protein 1 [Lotus japonicus]|uniref:elicitor-responsive protein 1 n=1 Tax=Lotus japonicus TaxID=34305 RepID=UPI002585920A|nr:elicitor-responsive protein 1 [Lotus japonicus]